MIKIKYNTPIEVSKSHYDEIMNKINGSCAGREQAGKYYIMLWSMYWRPQVERILNNNN